MVGESGDDADAQFLGALLLGVDDKTLLDQIQKTSRGDVRQMLELVLTSPLANLG